MLVYEIRVEANDIYGGTYHEDNDKEAFSEIGWTIVRQRRRVVAHGLVATSLAA